jgi:hypothetical protein
VSSKIRGHSGHPISASTCSIQSLHFHKKFFITSGGQSVLIIPEGLPKESIMQKAHPFCRAHQRAVRMGLLCLRSGSLCHWLYSRRVACISCCWMVTKYATAKEQEDAQAARTREQSE